VVNVHLAVCREGRVAAEHLKDENAKAPPEEQQGRDSGVNIYIHIYTYIFIICREGRVAAEHLKDENAKAPPEKQRGGDRVKSYLAMYIYMHIYNISIYICIYIPDICTL